MPEPLPEDAYEAYAGTDRVAEARAVAGPEPSTTYRVVDELGVDLEVEHAEYAERLSRAGLRVTAMTEGQR